MQSPLCLLKREAFVVMAKKDAVIVAAIMAMLLLLHGCVVAAL